MQHLSLRYQFLLVLTALLIIPVLVILYDIFFASKSEEVLIEEREERLVNAVQKIVMPSMEANLQQKLKNIKLSELDVETRTSFLQAAFHEATEPLLPNYQGVRFGLYIPENKQIFVQGFLRDYRQLSPEEARAREQRIFTEADSGIFAVLATGRPLFRITTSLNDQVMEYLVPLEMDGHILAVLWADERMHPIFAQTRNFRLLTRYIILTVLFAGALGALFITHNLASGVARIKQGLEELEKDLNRLLPPLPGEAGQIAQAINEMAIKLREREKLMEELSKAERLASLGRLVTGVAHELRNPIGVVKAAVQLMENEFKHIEELKEYTSMIKEQVERQNRVLQELLEFGRPSKNLVHPLNVNEIIAKVLVFTGPILRQHKISLTTELADTMPEILADGERIKQVFVNLIVNAVQAMPEGGQLEIKSSYDWEWVYVRFSDTGRGIAPEDLPRIFDPFFTTKDGGTGLGLSISHQIITSHGGRIEVESKPGEGTIFTVHLPIFYQRGGVNRDS